ncbi:hypothetical protein [Candidatus Liberibacter solanacearum]|uniref:Lipoprotein n=1 Tax=Candidatus Liberibacter solanacearum TaxID=556287 RepID=A0A1V2N977_9HYPH|nr:hypothetical protein [Candidatus Liberibacter solanacearum]ONI60215.1 hypothetical protein AYO25_00705 [Candidatus Liberibacter solanacearum]
MKTVKYYIPLFSLLSIALSSCNSTEPPPPPQKSLADHIAEVAMHKAQKKLAEKAAEAMRHHEDKKAADKAEEAPKTSLTESYSSEDFNNPTETT